MKHGNEIEQLAHYEIEWWKAHHRKDNESLIENMVQLYSLQFDISYKEARSAVLLRAEATKWHDEAEKHEDNGHQKQADIYWGKAEECLRRHFELLEKNK